MKNVIRPAGFWIRLWAHILDFIIISLSLAFILDLITGWSMQDDNPTLSILIFIYSIVLPICWSGYTVGKKFAGVRIVKVNGKKLGVGAMLLRGVVAGIIYTASLGLTVIISIFMVIFRRDKRSLHDLIAGTYVTYADPLEIEEYHTDERSNQIMKATSTLEL